MRKLFKFASLIMVIVLFFTSCTEKQGGQNMSSSYDNINKMLKGLKTYAGSADITYVLNKEEVTYKILQYATKEGKYRVEVVAPEEVKGSLSMFDGSTVFQKSDNNDNIVMSTTDDAERSQIFLTSFLKNYSLSDKISVSVSDFDDSSTTVLEASIPGEHSYMATEKLWVDNDTLLPKKLVIYDYDQVERIIVIYDQFVYNPVLSDNIFTMIDR